MNSLSKIAKSRRIAAVPRNSATRPPYAEQLSLPICNIMYLTSSNRCYVKVHTRANSYHSTEFYGLTPYISRDVLFTYTHVHALCSSKGLTGVISQISSVRSGICLYNITTGSLQLVRRPLQFIIH
jgi:hypothetical protein